MTIGCWLLLPLLAHFLVWMAFATWLRCCTTLCVVAPRTKAKPKCIPRLCSTMTLSGEITNTFMLSHLLHRRITSGVHLPLGPEQKETTSSGVGCCHRSGKLSSPQHGACASRKGSTDQHLAVKSYP